MRWAVLGIALGALIIVPFLLWEDAVMARSQSFIASESNRVLLALVAASLLALDLLLPIPSSFVAAAAVAALGGVAGAAVIWTGMSAGALAGYALGRSGGAPVVARVMGRSELERAERLMARYGSAMLVLCRGVPVLAEASVLVAGAAKLGFATFAWVTAAANLGLALAYSLLSVFGWSGPAAVLTPFALGIGVPAAAIALTKRLERRAEREA